MDTTLTLVVNPVRVEVGERALVEIVVVVFLDLVYAEDARAPSSPPAARRGGRRSGGTAAAASTERRSVAQGVERG